MQLPSKVVIDDCILIDSRPSPQSAPSSKLVSLSAPVQPALAALVHSPHTLGEELCLHEAMLVLDSHDLNVGRDLAEESSNVCALKDSACSALESLETLDFIHG